MTPSRFCQSGEAEIVKAMWHGAIGLLTLGAFAYNATAFCRRRESHLFKNAVVYGLATGFEARKVIHHLS